MTKEDLLLKLKSFTGRDPEVEHRQADSALLDYIDDEEITDAFWAIKKWYS